MPVVFNLHQVVIIASTNSEIADDKLDTSMQANLKTLIVIVGKPIVRLVSVELILAKDVKTAIGSCIRLDLESVGNLNGIKKIDGDFGCDHILAFTRSVLKRPLNVSTKLQIEWDPE